MEQYTFRNLMEVSVIMPVLFVLSIIMVMFAFERMWCFWTHGRVSGRFIKKLKNALIKGEKESIRSVCSSGKGFLAQALAAIYTTALTSEIKADKLLRIKRQQARTLLGKRLGFLGTLSNIAPLLGLLGTVMGIMRAFHDLSVSGSGGPNIIAAGVSEALITTIAGIAVAVVASVLNNYFISGIKTVTGHIDVLGQELILSVNGK